MSRRHALLHLDTTAGPAEIRISAAVFDCDGLLVDSESIWLNMISDWLAEHQTPQAQAEDFLGLSVDDTAGRLAEHFTSEDEAGAIANQLTHRYSSLLGAGVSPMPGAVRLFSALAKQVPVAVASNGLRVDVTAMLSNSGLMDLAQAVFTLEDVAAGKPAPDLYEQACQHLGAERKQAVAFEDSPAGAQAALAAGLLVVGVNANPQIKLPCTHRVESLDHIRLREQHVPSR
ncbi:HAD family hydrolase [Nesterenkonia muleiensis]|uniref:HAD family hydrolase n=1 Tax=Nesterenkonia muleiensis TaxID=2282648 RepID=UPI000E752838|nr:HAD family phosphatase [Nesterenkonia muleiensis]